MDNLVGGCKPLVDALVRCGLAWDDAPRWLDVAYRQHTPCRWRGVSVSVYALDDAP